MEAGGVRRKEAREGGGSDSVRFTHGIVDAYLHRRTPTRQDTPVTIKPAFASTLSFFDFAVAAVAYRDHVGSFSALFAVAKNFAFSSPPFPPFSLDPSRPSAKSFRIPECKRDAHARALRPNSNHVTHRVIDRSFERRRSCFTGLVILLFPRIPAIRL